MGKLFLWECDACGAKSPAAKTDALPSEWGSVRLRCLVGGSGPQLDVEVCSIACRDNAIAKALKIPPTVEVARVRDSGCRS